MEHEITDPYNLYYSGSANMYNPKIQHELSQAGAGGLGGPSAGNLAGRAETPRSQSSGGSGPDARRLLRDFQRVGGAGGYGGAHL